MALVETEGLVLKTYPLADADKIAVFFTKKNGLIRGVAKGAKRLKSRFGSGLELFSVVNLDFFQKEERELVSIGRIEIKQSYFAEAGNPEFLQKFSYLSDLLNEFAPPNEPNEQLYRMACICLETAKSNPESLSAIAVYFEIWILKLSGYLPDWTRCDGCRRLFAAGEDAGLQSNFHLLCSNCVKGGKRPAVSAKERQIFKDAQTFSPPKFIAATREYSAEINNLSAVLKNIITHILGKEPVGEKVIITSRR